MESSNGALQASPPLPLVRWTRLVSAPVYVYRVGQESGSRDHRLMTLLLSNLKLIFRAAVRLKFLIATNLAINKIILVNLTINRKVKPDDMYQLSSKAQFISLKSRNLILECNLKCWL